MEDLDKITDWDQQNVIHCTARGCKGMLLESIETYTFKCSNCNKYWDSYTEWREVNND